jgi:hypothetical protein
MRDAKAHKLVIKCLKYNYPYIYLKTTLSAPILAPYKRDNLWFATQSAMKTNLVLGYGIGYFINDYIPKLFLTNGCAWPIDPQNFLLVELERKTTIHYPK